VRRIALGLLVVWLDVRVAGWDLLPDPVGWLVVVLGLRVLVTADPRLRTALWGAVVVGVLSVAGVVVPVEAQRVAEPTGVQGLLTAVAGVGGSLVVAALAARLARAAVAGDVRDDAVTWVRVRVGWLVLAMAEAVVLVAVVVAEAGGGATGLENLAPLVLVTSFGGLALAVVTFVLLRRHALRPWAPARFGPSAEPLAG
jgi:hypothetical protein